MLYRKLGKTGLEVSALGFGCMRLPVVNNQFHVIDKEKAAELLHYAIDNGVNYVDTGYAYHGSVPLQEGTSENFLGEALQNGYREKVYLATKLPSWLVKTREDMDRILNQQLEKLKTDCIDCYLLHNMNFLLWNHLKKLGVTEFLDSAKAAGKIRFAGFSFHDDFKMFKEIVDSYDWDLCQIQYNFMDVNSQAGRRGLEYAGEKGLGLVIMEPLRGGNLANRIPAEVQTVWEQADNQRTPAEWSFRFIWNHPEVSVVLSGMNAMSQLVENIKVANEAYPNSLTDQELSLVDAARKVYQSRTKVDCTACRYCMPCPHGVNIPVCFGQLNNAYIYDDMLGAKRFYTVALQPGDKAHNCTECGECEEKCPQHIPIRDMLKVVVETFGGN